jgi:hypothetical protein
MEAQVKDLMRQLFESYLNSVEAILDMGLTPEDVRKVGGELQASVSEYFADLRWHDDNHLRQMLHTRQSLDPHCHDLMVAGQVNYALNLWGETRGRLIAELAGVTAGQLDAHPLGEAEWSIAEIARHVAGSDAWMVDNIRAAAGR